MSGELDYVARRAPRHEAIDVRGLTYRVTRWGPPQAQPVVLLHGFLDSGETWQFLVDELPQSWAFAAPDWRGFGASEWASDGYWFPDYLADLEVLLDELAPGAPARVIGHSMGGNIASLYAGVRPSRLAWLVNLEGFGLRRTAATEAPGRLAQWLDQLRAPSAEPHYASVDALAQRLLARNPRLDAGRARFIARVWTRPAGERRVLRHDPRHRLVNPVLYRREEAQACWRAATVPTLLLVGEHSESRRRLGEDGTDEALRANFPGAHVQQIPGVGHMMHHEDPQAIARAVAAFAAA
ncbi:MAG TPA: alpha/beta hydrolase [Steroidobacteraceae bacterium]